jgi:hypothetical protein
LVVGEHRRDRDNSAVLFCTINPALAGDNCGNVCDTAAVVERRDDN